MKLRWKILIGLGIVAVLAVASLWVNLHSQPASELEAYKRLLRGQGEKLEISEVAPPPVAPEENSVDAVREAFGMFGPGTESMPNAMRMVAPGKALIGWQQPDARNADFTNSWEQFAAGVAADAPAIELLHQVLNRPKLDFQLDYNQGARLPLPHLPPLKRSAQKLTSAAILELHNGDPGAAATNILTELALVHNTAAEGLLISHLVRIAITAIAVNPTWELLQATNVTDGQLAAVQKAWERLDFLANAENSFVTDRAWTSAEIQKTRTDPKRFEELFGSGALMGGPSGAPSWLDPVYSATEAPRHAAFETLWRSSWSYSAELQSLRIDQEIIEAARAMQTNRSQFYKADYDAMDSRLAALGFTKYNQTLFEVLQIPDWHELFAGQGYLTATLRKTLQIETARRIVVTAIALKRFQLAHGKWPDALADLTPQFLTAVPIDPYDGKPLKYHPNPDGTFLLYSAGEDGADNGGDATSAKTSSGANSWYWLRANDWVWPQPASPAEVQYFYDHPQN